MATLQQTFRYQGDPSQMIFPEIQIQLAYPVFEYHRTDAESNQIVRQRAGTQNTSTTQDVRNEKYTISFPSNAITGKDETINQFLSYTMQSFKLDSMLSDRLDVDFEVSFFGDDHLPVGTEKLTAMYFIKNINRFFRSVDIASPASSEWGGMAFDKSIFLINKEMYRKVLPEYNHIFIDGSSQSLLSLLQKLVEISDAEPTFAVELNDAFFEKLPVLFRENNIPFSNELSEFLKKYLRVLFDFPLTVPEIKSINIAGTFHIKTDVRLPSPKMI